MKTKPKGHTYWHRKLDKLQGKWLRETFKECSMCGRVGFQQVSHVYPKKTYSNLRYDPINILPMDGGCHEYRWHSNPLDSRDWFKSKYPQRWTYLQEAKNTFVKRNEEYYKGVEKALKEKRIRDLMILNYPIDK